NLGHYTIQLTALSDSADQFPGNETIVQKFSTSDTVLAKDNGIFNIRDWTGPQVFVKNGQAGGGVGDKFGTKFIVESQSGSGGITKIPTSISYRVYLDSSYSNIEILPRIWPLALSTTSLRLLSPIATSFLPFTISTSSIVDTFITLPLDFGPATINGLPDGEYVVGYEISQINGVGPIFRLLNNISGLSSQPLVSCFVDLAHAPGLAWVDVNPGIRLNFGNLAISTSLKDPLDSNSRVDVFPNPSKGEFSIQFKENKKEYMLHVINSLGQSVYNAPISGSAGSKKNLDLKFLNKGVYYLMFNNETESLVEVVVIN
ncbi:MAG: T9SS type A sorting domain-containing protein, partial [Flavobacteriales bacterium]|nr:T9SS type A sorting domain-containing protein [Flavobacteriales bacterium]